MTITPIGLPAAFPDPTLARTYESIFELIGNTPLVRVNGLAPRPDVSIYVKLDSWNPGRSAKDRIGAGIVRGAISAGALAAGDTVLDTGQGNTAIGYTLAGIATGHPVTAVAAPGISPEKRSLLAFLGARIVPGDATLPADDPENSAAVAQRLENEEADTWWARQKSNADNGLAHERSTGPEIWHQTGGRITHFVAGVATGGTISGTARYLKSRNPDVRIVATAFQESPSYEKKSLRRFFFKEPGWEQLEHDWPDNLDIDLLDDLVYRKRAEVIDFAWRAARVEGLLLGLSSFLNLLTAIELAETATEGDVIVAFVADDGRDYLSREYNAQWLAENGYEELAEKYA